MSSGNGVSGKSKFNALVSNAIENEKVFESICFSISKRLLIPSSAVGGGILDIVIDPTACTCSNLVFLPVAFKAFGAGPIFIDLYFGTNAGDDGTILESGNRDNVSSKTSELIYRLNPTINDPGIKAPFEFVILSDGVSAVAHVGGESREGQVFNARTDGKYMFRLTNQEANTAHGHVAANWYEVP